MMSARIDAEGLRSTSTAAQAQALPRVCFLADTFYPIVGGGETYLRNISSRLRAMGMGVFVLTRRAIPGMKPVDSVSGVPVYRVGPNGLVRFGKYAMLPAVAVWLFTHRRSYDVLYVSNFRALGPTAVVLARLLGKRCVLRAGICGEFSGRYIADLAPNGRRILSWLAAPLALRQAILRQADGFVSNCQAVTDELRHGGIPDEKVVQLPGGVDTEVFHPVDLTEKLRLRRQLGLPEACFLVGYSGKLNRGKGLHHLVAALPRILRRHSDVHVVLIGSGQHQFLSQEDDLRRMVSALHVEGHITFTGYVENVADHLQSLDLFVLPSEREALPNALLEAMACGLPCIATRVGGVPDVVNNSINGALIDPGNVQQLTHAICIVKADPGQSQVLAASARQTIEERYSVSRLAGKLREFLVALAVEPQGPLRQEQRC